MLTEYRTWGALREVIGLDVVRHIWKYSQQLIWPHVPRWIPFLGEHRTWRFGWVESALWRSSYMLNPGKLELFAFIPRFQIDVKIGIFQEGSTLSLRTLDNWSGEELTVVISPADKTNNNWTITFSFCYRILWTLFCLSFWSWMNC